MPEVEGRGGARRQNKGHGTRGTTGEDGLLRRDGHPEDTVGSPPVKALLYGDRENAAESRPSRTLAVCTCRVTDPPDGPVFAMGA